MVILKGNCKSCGCEIKLDIGDKTIEEVIEGLENRQGFECPGHHVELDAPCPAYWKVDEWEQVEGSAPTDEEFLDDLKSKYEEVIDTEEMSKRGIITSFAFGMPMTNDGKNWNFTNSPSGKRYYYHD